MSLLGIDVGTTGCKSALFTEEGRQLALAYEEYDILHPHPGWAELDAGEVLNKVKRTVVQVAGQAGRDTVRALAVSSLGEAVVPVTAGRQVLGRSILNFDVRGEEYLPELSAVLPAQRLYRINGNTIGNHYGLTKLKWIQEHQESLYAAADYLLNWSSFIAFMLGAQPVLDYSLANRSLLFDIDAGAWSVDLMTAAGVDGSRLPPLAPSGSVVGEVSPAAAAELGLQAGTTIIAGAHDQCANALGSGAVQPGQAMYGMGSFHCIAPVFNRRLDPTTMVERGLCTEHHAVPGCYVTFIYNQVGSVVKWYRDTFAAAEHHQALLNGVDVYPDLFGEIPPGPSSVLVLPHFSTGGPPDFISNSSGVLTGLRLETRRGEILKGILESAVFSLKSCIDLLPATGIQIDEYRVVGGGSKSNAWVQICADIMGRPVMRPVATEAGALGAAIIAGIGKGVFSSFSEGVQAMVRLERSFEPDESMRQKYQERFDLFSQLWPSLKEFLPMLSRQSISSQ